MLTAPFINSYAALPERFFARQKPVAVAKPVLIKFNAALGQTLGLDPTARSADELAAIFSGNIMPENAKPLAMAYAGHQFGQFVPQLGDGRAILLGDLLDRDGKPRDIQLKGAGRTPYSRGGDGRAAIGPVLREYVVSEAMHALGIPSTRALAAIASGEWVYRDDKLPGAILTRVASSHLRVGTFQFFAARDDLEGVRQLADYAIARHYPEAMRADNRYRAFLDQVISAQASLIAKWMLVGFIHGVMNTDNMTISGETIDFGPCAFMEAYDPAKTFSAIDQRGRYAFGNQPRIAQWNLARLAETLLELLDDDQDRAMEIATALINDFPARFQQFWLDGMRCKLGFTNQEPGDHDLANGLLSIMQENQIDYTNGFRRLTDASADTSHEADLAALFSKPDAITEWLGRWRARLARQDIAPSGFMKTMKAANPAFIPRNHRVEQMIAQAVDTGRYDLFEALLQVVGQPFDDQPAFAAYADPASPEEEVHRTYCGT